MIDKHATIVATDEHVSSDLAGETVILNLSDGTYYGLNETGTHVWEMLDEPRSVKELHASLLELYDVPADVCMNDLLTLLNDMEQHQLVQKQ